MRSILLVAILLAPLVLVAFAASRWWHEITHPRFFVASALVALYGIGFVMLGPLLARAGILGSGPLISLDDFLSSRRLVRRVLSYLLLTGFVLFGLRYALRRTWSDAP